MASAEHEAVAAAIDAVLKDLHTSALIGVFEGERRTFDYSCLLNRDLGRPLVAQVLWRHEHGLEKDLRTLLFDEGSTIKLYVLRDSTRIRATLDDVLKAYRRNPLMRQRLLGLRLVFVPPDFDADKQEDHAWLRTFLSSSFLKDIAFGIVFGGLTKHALEIFIRHNGPFGLKYAILHEIGQNGLIHTPTFKERLEYKTTGPIREAVAMLNAAGLIRNLESSVCYFPTLRGRFVLDLTRRFLLDIEQRADWSSPTRFLLDALGMDIPPFPEDTSTLKHSDPFASNLVHAGFCASHFGRDLLDGIDRDSPVLYSDFPLEDLIHRMADHRGFSYEFFAEPEFLFSPTAQKGH
jgi:hypothetical protein